MIISAGLECLEIGYDVLTKDEEGYYSLVVGGLNVTSLNGPFYPATDEVKKKLSGL